MLIILKVSHVFIRNSCITLLLPERVLPTLTAKISIISETTKVFVRKFECNAFTTSIRSQSPMPANSESEAYGLAVRSLRTEGYDVSRRRIPPLTKKRLVSLRVCLNGILERLAVFLCELDTCYLSISSKIRLICILRNRTCRFERKSCLYWSGVFYRGFILSILADKLRLIRSPYFSPPSLLYFFRKCFEVKVH